MIFISAIFSFLLTSISCGAPTYRYTCSWENSGAPIAPYWYITMSADGQTQAAVDTEFFYYSTDAGQTFSKREMEAYAVWMSANGSMITAAGAENYFVSSDSGLTWANETTPGLMTVVGMNPTGKYQLISGENFFLTSNDFGLTFTQHQANNTGSYSWQAIISAEGDLQVPTYLTNSSYVSIDKGEEFTQVTDVYGIVPKNVEIEWVASNANYSSSLLALETGLYQSQNYTNFTKIMDGIFVGAAMSLDGQYQLANTLSKYYISSDYGFSWTLGDGLPSADLLGNVLLSNNGSVALMDTWSDDGHLFKGSCGWSFNPFVTATVIDVVENVVLVQTTINVVVNSDIYN